MRELMGWKEKKMSEWEDREINEKRYVIFVYVHMRL